MLGAADAGGVLGEGWGLAVAYSQTGALAGAQAATVTATRPVPARAAPRRNPRRVREASSTAGPVVSGSGRDGGMLPWGVVVSMDRDGTRTDPTLGMTFGPFAVGRPSPEYACAHVSAARHARGRPLLRSPG